MAEFLGWLAEGGEQLTVVTVLVIVLFVVVYGAQENEKFSRPWWVAGWQYRDCRKREALLEERVQRYVNATEERLEKLEARMVERSRQSEGV